MHKAIVSVLIASIMVLGNAAPAAAAAPTAPSFQPFESLFTAAVPPFTNVRCDQNGGPSSFQYTATGEASGPYSGTFRESGTVLIGPQSNPGPAGIPVFSGLTVRWYAYFDIVSPIGRVRGVKWLAGDPNGFARCVSGPPIIPANNTDQRASALLRYFAVIQTSSGFFWDQGITTANVSQCDCFVGSDIVRVSSFLETYRSDYPTAQRGFRFLPPVSD